MIGGIIIQFKQVRYLMRVDDIEKFTEKLPKSGWSESVALDPKHRPQTLDKSATTVRREWSRWPQEAHLLDEKKNRYRRLSVEEVATIQGFPISWFNNAGISEKESIEALGNAVPPAMSRAIFNTINEVWKWKSKSAIEICAGIGGLSIGSHKIGLRSDVLLEFWEPACKVLRNLDFCSPSAVRCEDVNKYEFSVHSGKTALLAGGPPCQPWSSAGKRKGLLDERDLMGATPEFISASQPEVFVFENVPGLVRGDEHKGYVKSLVERMSDPLGDGTLRYGVGYKIFNAADYGVPQRRKRVFFIGFRDKSHTFAEAVLQRIESSATHCDPDKPSFLSTGEARLPWVTLGDAFAKAGIKRASGWRTFLDKVGSSGDGLEVVDEKEIVCQGNVFQSVSESQKTQLTEAQTHKIRLSWPSQEKSVENLSDGWRLISKEKTIKFRPLVSIDGSYFNHIESSSVLAIFGDTIAAIEALSKIAANSVQLCYFDAPRIKSLAVGSKELTNSTWMTIIHSVAQRARMLLAPDGTFALQVNDASAHYARVILEQVFGPQNYVCTVVWQKKYGPQGDLDVPTDAQDYLIVFARKVGELPLIGIPKYDNLTEDGDPRGPWRAAHKGARSGNDDTKFQTKIPPYRWSLSDGDLPVGLWRINPYSGVIWGIPTQTGTFKFTVSLSDKEGNTTSKILSISINEKSALKTHSTNSCDVWWLFETEFGQGGLEILEDGLIGKGSVGKEFSHVLRARGGVPFPGSKAPGSGRYWEFAAQTLINAIISDNVHFGAAGNAIPAIKKHSESTSTPRVTRTTTWWDYKTAGKSEDASKHLKELAEQGLIERADRIAKPERLMKRIIQLFAQDSSGLILSLGDSTASMTSTAIKMGRRVLHVIGNGEGALDLWHKCACRRVQAVIDGLDNSALSISGDDDVKWKGGGGLGQFKVGTVLFEYDPVSEELVSNLDNVDIESRTFRDALITLAGFMPVDIEEPKGVALNGRSACVAVFGQHITEMMIGEIQDRLLSEYEHVTILYESADLPDSYEPLGKTQLMRIPFDLV